MESLFGFLSSGLLVSCCRLKFADVGVHACLPDLLLLCVCCFGAILSITHVHGVLTRLVGMGCSVCAVSNVVCFC